MGGAGSAAFALQNVYSELRGLRLLEVLLALVRYSEARWPLCRCRRDTRIIAGIDGRGVAKRLGLDRTEAVART
jgi:hypothetical protein